MALNVSTNLKDFKILFIHKGKKADKIIHKPIIEGFF